MIPAQRSPGRLTQGHHLQLRDQRSAQPGCLVGALAAMGMDLLFPLLVMWSAATNSV